MEEERFEELAALNALGMLENDEKRALDGAIARDKDLRVLTAELELTAAELTRLITPMEPPPDMKKRIRAKLRSSGVKVAGFSRSEALGGIGWALAALFAVVSAWLWHEREKFEQQLASLSRAMTPVAPAANPAVKTETRNIEDELKNLRSDFESKKTALSVEIESLRKRETDANAHIAQITTEMEALKQHGERAQLQVRTLPSSTIWEYRRGTMVVVWDSEQGQGVLMLDKMPKPETGKDYQLWIIDPKKPDPVSAGVVVVDGKNMLKTSFKPAEAVKGDAKFALSIENKGGVAKPEGRFLISGP